MAELREDDVSLNPVSSMALVWLSTTMAYQIRTS